MTELRQLSKNSMEGILMEGITSVVKDHTFVISSGPASSTRMLAEHLSLWIPEHQDVAHTFETKMIDSLSNCLKVRQSTQKANREKMWSAYRSQWNTFLAVSGSSVSSSSIFCQYVGHYMFKQLIKRHLPIFETAQPKETSFIPTYEEINGIRYAAGWVVWAVKKKLKKSSHPLKGDLELCRWDLLDEGDEGPQESKEWIDTVDQGGLSRVNNMTFELFLTMEKTLRNIVSTGPTACIPTISTERIKLDDDVQFIWCIISSDWAEASADTLLEMIIHEWTKIRGFSNASAWVEKYKSEQRKTIQKTKGVSKQLQSMPPKTKKARMEPECESD